MERAIRLHVEAFIVGMYKHVRHTVWEVIRTGLIAFVVFVVVGGAALTVVILALGAAPTGSLAVVSYVMLGLAALAGTVAAMAVHLCWAVLRGVERAALDVVAEVGKVERELVHTVTETVVGGPPR